MAMAWAKAKVVLVYVTTTPPLVESCAACTGQTSEISYRCMDVNVKQS